MKPRVHFESIRRSEFRTITTTLCNRMVADGEIKCSQWRTDVTCKFCLKLLMNVKREAEIDLTTIGRELLEKLDLRILEEMLIGADAATERERSGHG